MAVTNKDQFASHFRKVPTMNKSIFVLIAVLIAQSVVDNSARGQEKNEPPVTEQCQSVCQDKDAAWRTVAWETDLLEAQKLAVEQEKPLFVWAMDGHPLGCT